MTLLTPILDLALDNYNKIAGYLSRYVSSRDPDAIKKAKVHLFSMHRH